MRKDKLIFGLLLLFFGVVFLLININVLEWSDLKSLWKLWPLLLVLMGIDIMFKDRILLRDILISVLILGTLLIWLIFKVVKTSEFKSQITNSSFMEYKIEEDEIYFNAELFGDVTIFPTDKKSIFVKTELPEKIEKELKIEKDGNRYYLKFLGLKELRHIKKDSLRIEIGLPVKTILNLNLSGGAIKGNFNFGDLSIRKLEFAFGAGSIYIEFPMLNNLLMEEFKISSGASALYIDKIGNANFDKCEISTGASSVVIDLSGKWRKNALLVINSAVGNLHIKFPQNTEFSIETEGILNPGLKEKLSKNPQFKIIIKGALNNINYTEYE